MLNQIQETLKRCSSRTHRDPRSGSNTDRPITAPGWLLSPSLGSQNLLPVPQIKTSLTPALPLSWTPQTPVKNMVDAVANEQGFASAGFQSQCWVQTPGILLESSLPGHQNPHPLGRDYVSRHPTCAEELTRVGGFCSCPQKLPSPPPYQQKRKALWDLFSLT